MSDLDSVHGKLSPFLTHELSPVLSKALIYCIIGYFCQSCVFPAPNQQASYLCLAGVLHSIDMYFISDRIHLNFREY
jgi:hypothetical protein